MSNWVHIKMKQDQQLNHIDDSLIDSTRSNNDLILNQQQQDTDEEQSTTMIQRLCATMEKGSLRGAIFTLVASATGPGIFNMALRVSQVGIIPFLFYVIGNGLFSYIGVSMISSLITHYGFTSYSSMTQYAFGAIISRLTQFCLILYPLGIAICFQVVFARFLIELLSDIALLNLFDNRDNDITNSTGNLIRILINIFGILLNLFFILKKQLGILQKLAAFSVLAVFTNILTIIITCLVGFTKTDQNGTQLAIYHGLFHLQWSKISLIQISSLRHWSWQLQASASILFAYVNQQLVFPLYIGLKKSKPSQYNIITNRVHIIQLLCYSLIGLSGYLLLIEHQDSFPISSMVIASIQTWPMSIGKLMIVIGLFILIPINLFATRQVVYQTFKIAQTTRNHIIISLILAFSSCAIAILFEQVNGYFGILGGTAGVLIAGGIPALCYWKLMKLYTEDYLKIIYCLLIVIYSMIGGVLSVIDP